MCMDGWMVTLSLTDSLACSIELNVEGRASLPGHGRSVQEEEEAGKQFVSKNVFLNLLLSVENLKKSLTL